jgi:hypothetical protein
MSSTELLIAEIKQEFSKVLAITEQAALRISDAKHTSLEVNEAKTLFEAIVKFQRFLESKQFQLNALKGTAYYDRTTQELNKILFLFASGLIGRPAIDVGYEKDEFVEVGSGSGIRRYEDPILGLVGSGRTLVERSRRKVITAQERSISNMISILNEIDLDLVELYSDIRLMTELMIFPLEQRTKLKDSLVQVGFKEAVAYLENAEQHLVEKTPKLKDCLSNCRLAIESVVYKILAEAGGKPVNRFSIDLIETSKITPALIDEATKKMLQATYDYLSIKGSHIFSEVNQKDMAEVEFGLDQTYRIVSHILNRYVALKKSSGHNSS